MCVSFLEPAGSLPWCAWVLDLSSPFLGLGEQGGPCLGLPLRCPCRQRERVALGCGGARLDLGGDGSGAHGDEAWAEEHGTLLLVCESSPSRRILGVFVTEASMFVFPPWDFLVVCFKRILVVIH